MSEVATLLSMILNFW